jgi:hypothetical protein
MLISGLSGSLLSHDALARLGAGSPLPLAPPGGAAQRLRVWHTNLRGRLGPSSGPRAVFDEAAEPLARALGFRVLPLAGDADLSGATPIKRSAETTDALLEAGGVPAAVMIVSAWGQVPISSWRQAIHRGLAHGCRWCLCVSGTAVRLVDADRAYSRRHAEFDLALTFDDERTLSIFWGLLHATALLPGPEGAVLDRVVALCEQHRTSVRLSLRDGVHEALLLLVDAFRAASRRRPDTQLLGESMIVVHRMLFLLFAEARGLVPTWHPIYRDGYTLEALCRHLERGMEAPGIWDALQAIARLAHRGCRAGTLRVPPFNGRLFSPAEALLADSVALDDRAVGRALMALTTRKAVAGTERISYADLGVEQLGAVYEHLLDYDLAAGRAGVPAKLVATGRRKATGSFYTPRSLTEFLVRRTLTPIVHGAPSERILALRVLDPAMGSGAFLVAACRYLAAAYEQALVQEGAVSAHDLTEDDRAGFRRTVAQRCLFGVDVNPVAVHLGRLSLWLATLAGDKPLTFLDHRLRPGNSLVGGSIEDILRHPSPGSTRRTARPLPLFSTDDLRVSLESAVGVRLNLARTPDDTVDQVRSKERALSSLNATGAGLDRWKTAANLWCAAWFGTGAIGRGPIGALLDRILKDDRALPRQIADPLLAAAAESAAALRFFHWPLEFPEVFYDEGGGRLPDAGFDAIIGNPPWDMLREDQGTRRISQLSAFVRGSGVFRLQGHGHGNLYQLFVERTLQWLKPGGRAGLILPSGFATDHACAALRRHVMERATIDTFTCVENREGIFPIHRSLKFLLMTLTNGGATFELPFRSGVRSPDALDRVPDRGVEAATVAVPRALIDRISGDSLAVPDIRTPRDLEIASMVAFHVPVSADPAGWNIRFSRELNATDDRPHFSSDEGLPVIEGKQLRPFAVDTAAARYRIPRRVAARLLDPKTTFERARLGYRDVASPGNRMTLIAAIVPAGVVTTHTVFCLRNALDEDDQQFLCAIFNSYVANYLVRMRVGTHVTTAVMARLPLPRPPKDDGVFRLISTLGRTLSSRFEPRVFARLNAVVARLYGLSRAQFARVLETFPLIPAAERAEAEGIDPGMAV